MYDASPTRYEAAPGLSWVVQYQGVLLLDELAREEHVLGYPEAAIWELLLRGHDSGEAARLLQWIADLSPDEARGLVATRAAQWLAAGWLRVAADGAPC